MSDSWRGFKKFTLLKETPPEGHVWSGEKLTKIQTTTRPDHVWLKAWSRIGKTAQKREKQEWAIEKPKLDKARRLRCIYSIEPEDEEYRTIFFNKKNARRKCEVSASGRSYAGQKEAVEFIQLSGNWSKFQKQNMVAEWKLTNPRERVWKLLYQKITKIISQAKDTTR